MANRGLDGNFQAQPRVFAHDMIPVAIGNINPDGGLKMTSGVHGSGSYNPDQIITLTTPGGATQAAKIKVLTVNNEAVTFHNPIKGEILPVSVVQVYATGTEGGVENLVALS